MNMMPNNGMGMMPNNGMGMMPNPGPGMQPNAVPPGLLDAIGKSILKMEQVQNATLVEARAEKVLFVITTDGEENASVEFTYPKIKKLIERQKERGWEFIFLGANIDAIGEASKLGIEAERAVQYHADSEGTQVNFATLSEAIVEFRQTGKIKSKWKEKIEHDFSSR